jgi:putative MATE family efflux protein
MNKNPSNSKLKQFISNFRIAVLGLEKDFISGSIERAIFMLSVPMILEMMMESLFAVVDVFFVGKLGVDAIATVGLTEAIIMIVYSICVGLSMGITAMVSRRVGEKKHKDASDVAFQGILIGVFLAFIIGVTGFIFAKDLLHLMGASDELISQGYGYTQVLIGGNVTIMLLFILNAVFRGAGDASIAMRALWVSNGLNLILDPLFIFGIGPWEGFGVQGAAIATTIGRSVGVGYQLYVLFNGRSVIKLIRANMVFKFKIMQRLIKVSLGGMGQYLISTASWIFLVRIISYFGSDAVAGYTISIRIIIFTILPSWGISNAAATLVGQNLGANQPERAEKSVWKCAFYNMLFLFIISVVFFIFAEFLVGIFNAEGEVLKNGVIALRYICAGYLFFAYGMVVSQAFNGAGDTRTPTIVNFFSYWMLQIPLAYILAMYTDFEIKGIYIAILAAEIFLAIVVVLIFRKGKWKLVKV